MQIPIVYIDYSFGLERSIYQSYIVLTNEKQEYDKIFCELKRIFILSLIQISWFVTT